MDRERELNHYRTILKAQTGKDPATDKEMLEEYAAHCEKVSQEDLSSKWKGIWRRDARRARELLEEEE